MKILKMLLLIMLSSLFVTSVFAKCEDKELIDAANKIQVNFIEDKDFTITVADESGRELTTTIERQYTYVLAFEPYNKDLLIGVEDTINNTRSSAIYSSLYKKLIYGAYLHYQPKKYNIYIYSLKETSCYKQLLRTFTYTAPAFNEFSISAFCKENPNLKECKIDYDSSKLDNDYIEKLIEKTNVSNMTVMEKIVFNVKKYWYFILLPIIVISFYYLIKIIIFKKGEKKK